MLVPSNNVNNLQLKYVPIMKMGIIVASLLANNNGKSKSVPGSCACVRWTFLVCREGNVNVNNNFPDGVQECIFFCTA